MTDTKDMVVFLMPDGSKVSNDPRFDMEQAREDMLAATVNTGVDGVPRYEQEAQTAALHTAELNSGQPGVGENPTPKDPADHLPTMGSGAQVQKDDVKEAAETGATPPTAEVPDSNEAVLAAREAADKEKERLAKAQSDLGDAGEGDPEVDKADWSAKQLKYEAFKRNAERDADSTPPELDLSGVKKKGDLVDLLKADDEALGSQA